MGSLFLFDTNAVSDLIKSRSQLLRQKWLQTARDGEAVAISPFTHGEILFGFAKNPEVVHARAAYQNFLAETKIMPWTDKESGSYALLRHELLKQGKVVDTIDLLIASQAHALGATLISRDNHFRFLSHLLQVVNWATDYA